MAGQILCFSNGWLILLMSEDFGKASLNCEGFGMIQNSFVVSLNDFLRRHMLGYDILSIYIYLSIYLSIYTYREGCPWHPLNKFKYSSTKHLPKCNLKC